MAEADAGASENQQATNPEWRRVRAFRGAIEARVADHDLHQQEQQSSAHKAHHRGYKEGAKYGSGLGPIDSARVGLQRHELIGQAHSDDRTDQGVRARGWKSERPRSEV